MATKSFGMPVVSCSSAEAPCFAKVLSPRTSQVALRVARRFSNRSCLLPSTLKPSVIRGSRRVQLVSRCKTSAVLATPGEVQEEVDPAQAEAAAERALREGRAATICGIPRSEWVKLQTPARYLGNEFGAIHKPWDSATVRVSLTYPEIYEVGASNLGHIVLYSCLNEEEGLLCDRSYMPADDMQQLLARYDKPLFAVESKRPLGDFDTLGFSLSYELGAVNILQMLHLARIPISARERMEAEGGAETPFDVEAGSAPLIFAGGPTATSNPEPFAEFFDFVALGDGEDLLPEIGHSLRRSKAEKCSREEVLYRLATEVKGVYVPMFYDSPAGWGGAVFPIREGVPSRPLRRVAYPDPFKQIGLVPYVQTVHDRLTVEIRRGCTRGCRFCQPGMLTRPARDVDPSTVVDAVEQGMRSTGYNEFSLLSLSCSDYLALPSVGLEIKNRLKHENVSLSLPSQRVDRFDDSIAKIIGGTRKGGLTFAPEAGTQRLRDIINKGLTNEELLRGVRTAWEKGWRKCKLYFMVGLPGETDADIQGIVETVKWLQRECSNKRKSMQFSLTISNFTPKPHTPFQWHSVSTEEFERKHEVVRAAFKEQRVRGVKYSITSLQISAMEDFIGRGDRSIGPVIRRAWELTSTNDVWWMDPDAAFASYEKAIEESGVGWKYRQTVNGEWDVMENMGDGRYRRQGGGGKGRIDRGELADKRLQAPLPWDHIDTGISKTWLATDLQRALEAATVPDCSHSGLCSECGVCGDEFGDNVVAEVPPLPESDGRAHLDGTRAQRLRLRLCKGAEMAFVGHLDLMNTVERALRRAALPVTMDESPFSARPRISSALPLPLGYTSDDEVVEVELTEKWQPQQFREAVAAQLPGGLALRCVEQVPIWLTSPREGSNKKAASATGLLESLDWLVAVQVRPKPPAPPAAAPPPAEEGAEGAVAARGSSAGEEAVGAEGSLSEEEAQGAARQCVEATLQRAEFVISRESAKSKKKAKRGGGGKPQMVQVDLRAMLHSLSLCHPLEDTPLHGLFEAAPDVVLFRYRGKQGLGVPLMLQLLEGAADGQYSFDLLCAHREATNLREQIKPPPDYKMLARMAHVDGYLALSRRFGVPMSDKGSEAQRKYIETLTTP